MTSTVNIRAEPPIQRTWASRNWKWAVPAVALGTILVVSAFVITLVLVVSAAMTSSTVCVAALERARSDDQVLAQLGEPIETGRWLTGSMNFIAPSGRADLAIPIHGPRGQATLYLRAEKMAGEWQYEILEVAIAGQEGHIKLLTSQEQGGV